MEQVKLVCNPFLHVVEDFIVALDVLWGSGKQWGFFRDLDKIV
jgi:hypothetical protein